MLKISQVLSKDRQTSLLQFVWHKKKTNCNPVKEFRFKTKSFYFFPQRAIPTEKYKDLHFFSKKMLFFTARPNPTKILTYLQSYICRIEA